MPRQHGTLGVCEAIPEGFILPVLNDVERWHRLFVLSFPSNRLGCCFLFFVYFRRRSPAAKTGVRKILSLPDSATCLVLLGQESLRFGSCQNGAAGER